MTNYDAISSCKNFDCILDTALYMQTKMDFFKQKKFLSLKNILKISDYGLKLKLIIFFLVPKQIINMYYKKNDL